MCTLVGWTDQPENPTHVPHVRGGGVWLWCVVVVSGRQLDPMQNGTVWTRAERNLTKNKEEQENGVCRTAEEDVPFFHSSCYDMQSRSRVTILQRVRCGVICAE